MLIFQQYENVVYTNTAFTCIFNKVDFQLALISVYHSYFKKATLISIYQHISNFENVGRKMAHNQLYMFTSFYPVKYHEDFITQGCRSLRKKTKPIRVLIKASGGLDFTGFNKLLQKMTHFPSCCLFSTSFSVDTLWNLSNPVCSLGTYFVYTYSLIMPYENILCR